MYLDCEAAINIVLMSHSVFFKHDLSFQIGFQATVEIPYFLWYATRVLEPNVNYVYVIRGDMGGPAGLSGQCWSLI